MFALTTLNRLHVANEHITLKNVFTIFFHTKSANDGQWSSAGSAYKPYTRIRAYNAI